MASPGTFKQSEQFINRLDELKTRYLKLRKDGGTFEPKYRLTVEKCWDGLSKVAIQYWQWIKKPWPTATPKEVEKEWGEVATATYELINAMRRLSSKSFEMAMDFERQIAKKHTCNSPIAAMDGQIPLEDEGAIEQARVERESVRWFLDNMPREMRVEGPRKRFRAQVYEEDGSFNRAKWDDICDGKNIRHLAKVYALAKHFEAMASAIKVKRTKAGFGATWGKEIWEEDPEGVLCRAVHSLLVERKLFRTHTGAIAREIYIWAHPELPEEKCPTAQFFGARRVK